MLNLKDFQIQFNQAFDQFLKAHPFPNDHEEITPLVSYCNQLFSTTGKRIRPYLAYLGTGTSDISKSINLLIAIELIHSFALIHDDIMDESPLRRGKTSIHKYITDFYQARSASKAEHIGISQAILLGDYYFALAEKAFSSLHKEFPQTFDQLTENFYLLKNEVIWGQMLDIDLTTKQIASLQQIEDKNYFKTASYSVIRPLQLGLIMNNQFKYEDLAYAEEFGRSAGIGFQIQDDYLNLFYPAEMTGKQQYLDISESQNTVFKNYLTSQNDTIKSNYLEVEGKPLTPDNIEKITKLINQTDLKHYGNSLIQDHYKKAQETLAKWSLDEKIKHALKQVIILLSNRTH